MRQVAREVDRYLTLISDKLRSQGYTQLEVQKALSWGRSYISQLVTKQKSLRLDQLLLILDVIGVDPKEFFSELYNPAYHQAGGGASISPETAAKLRHEVPQLKLYLHAVRQQLLDRGVISADDLEDAVGEAARKIADGV